jgi:long-chain acyl-CoA synthetase
MERFWLKYYPHDIPYEIDPEEFRNIHEILQVKAQKHPDYKCFTCMDKSITFGELNALSDDFAAYLQQELGLKKGDHLAMMLPNTLQYIIAIFGALKAGLVIINVNPFYTPEELAYQMKDSQTDAILVLDIFAHKVSSVLPELKLKHVIISKLGDLLPFPKRNIVNFIVKYIKRVVPKYDIPGAKYFLQGLKRGKELTLDPVDVDGEDIAFLQYTGGTTGVSKGAILTHRNMVANIVQSASVVKPSFPEGKCTSILPLPLYHIYSLEVSMALFLLGEHTVLIVNPRDIPSFVHELKKVKYDLFIGLNTLFHALVNHEAFCKLDFPEHFITLSGGMACKQIVADQWKKVTGSVVLEGYGLTETSPVVALSSPDTDHFTGTVGFPIPNVDIDIIDPEGKSLPIGQEGEICVKGPNVMRGYWNKPDEDEKVFTEDGWFKTGDLGVMNADGTLKIVERIKDLIIVGGFNVYPNEVEEVLMKHLGISEAAIVAEPDIHSGEIIKAFIVKRDPKLTEADVREHCKKYLTNYKRPTIIVFRSELPKSIVGKVLRKKLRQDKTDPEGKWLKAA